MFTTTLQSLRPSWAKASPAISGRDAHWWSPKKRVDGVEVQMCSSCTRGTDGLWSSDGPARVWIDGVELTMAQFDEVRDAIDKMRGEERLLDLQAAVLDRVTAERDALRADLDEIQRVFSRLGLQRVFSRLRGSHRSSGAQSIDGAVTPAVRPIGRAPAQ